MRVKEGGQFEDRRGLFANRGKSSGVTGIRSRFRKRIFVKYNRSPTCTTIARFYATSIPLLCRRGVPHSSDHRQPVTVIDSRDFIFLVSTAVGIIPVSESGWLSRARNRLIESTSRRDRLQFKFSSIVPSSRSTLRPMRIVWFFFFYISKCLFFLFYRSVNLRI